jgi:hypothetical protein
MAAYASTITIYSQGVERISRNMGILAGRIDITNYNTTTVEETEITRLFRNSAKVGLEKGIISFHVSSTEKGFILSFDKSTGKFKAFSSQGYTPAGTISKPTFTVTKGAILANTELGLSADAATATVNNDTIAATLALTTNSPVSVPVFTGTPVAASEMAEVANDTDLGTFDFFAIGFKA